MGVAASQSLLVVLQLDLHVITGPAAVIILANRLQDRPPVGRRARGVGKSALPHRGGAHGHGNARGQMAGPPVARGVGVGGHPPGRGRGCRGRGGGLLVGLVDAVEKALALEPAGVVLVVAPAPARVGHRLELAVAARGRRNSVVGVARGHTRGRRRVGVARQHGQLLVGSRPRPVTGVGALAFGHYRRGRALPDLGGARAGRRNAAREGLLGVAQDGAPGALGEGHRPGCPGVELMGPHDRRGAALPHRLLHLQFARRRGGRGRRHRHRRPAQPALQGCIVHFRPKGVETRRGALGNGVLAHDGVAGAGQLLSDNTDRIAEYQAPGVVARAQSAQRGVAQLPLGVGEMARDGDRLPRLRRGVAERYRSRGRRIGRGRRHRIRGGGGPVVIGGHGVETVSARRRVRVGVGVGRTGVGLPQGVVAVELDAGDRPVRVARSGRDGHAAPHGERARRHRYRDRGRRIGRVRRHRIGGGGGPVVVGSHGMETVSARRRVRVGVGVGRTGVGLPQGVVAVELDAGDRPVRVARSGRDGHAAPRRERARRHRYRDRGRRIGRVRRHRIGGGGGPVVVGSHGMETVSARGRVRVGVSVGRTGVGLPQGVVAVELDAGDGSVRVARSGRDGHAAPHRERARRDRDRDRGRRIGRKWRHRIGGGRGPVVVGGHGVETVSARGRVRVGVGVGRTGVGLPQRVVAVELDAGDRPVRVARSGRDGHAAPRRERARRDRYRDRGRSVHRHRHATRCSGGPVVVGGHGVEAVTARRGVRIGVFIGRTGVGRGQRTAAVELDAGDRPVRVARSGRDGHAAPRRERGRRGRNRDRGRGIGRGRGLHRHHQPGIRRRASEIHHVGAEGIGSGRRARGDRKARRHRAGGLPAKELRSDTRAPALPASITAAQVVNGGGVELAHVGLEGGREGDALARIGGRITGRQGGEQHALGMERQLRPQADKATQKSPSQCLGRRP